MIKSIRIEVYESPVGWMSAVSVNNETIKRVRASDWPDGLDRADENLMSYLNELANGLIGKANKKGRKK